MQVVAPECSIDPEEVPGEVTETWWELVRGLGGALDGKLAKEER